MEDFLNQIHQSTIQDRNKKLQVLIQQSKALIIEKIKFQKSSLIEIYKKKQIKKAVTEHSLSIDILSSKNYESISQGQKENYKNNKSGQIDTFSNNLSLQSFQQCFTLFQRASNNILNTYFSLLVEDQFLSLQSQQQVFCYFREIQDKIYFFKKTVEKSIFDISKKINKLSSLKSQSLKLDAEVVSENEELSFEAKSSEKCSKRNKMRRKKMIKKGKNSKIPYHLTLSLQKWLIQHFNDPYPSIQVKKAIAKDSGLTFYQVNNWFINARQRVIKKFIRKSNIITESNSEESFTQKQQLIEQKKVKKIKKGQKVKSKNK